MQSTNSEYGHHTWPHVTSLSLFSLSLYSTLMYFNNNFRSTKLDFFIRFLFYVQSWVLNISKCLLNLCWEIENCNRTKLYSYSNFMYFNNNSYSVKFNCMQFFFYNNLLFFLHVNIPAAPATSSSSSTGSETSALTSEYFFSWTIE